MSRLLDRFDVVLERSIYTVGILLLTLMIVQITVDVILRSAFHGALPGTVEIVSNYYMVGLSFLPIVLAERQGRQISASFLYSHLPRFAQIVAELIARALGVVIFGLLTWRSLVEAMAKTRIGAFALSGSDRITIWPAYWVLPVAFALVTIALLLPRSRRSKAAQTL
ncbi:TRAP transporter small permease [Rhodobacter sp. NTK016B]|uniref:TRAP transporter small permease n=1 Tax=Rhodobacter sp. NTK016B TaxID=2759676 RepID=UPI001A9010D0|nr:TRAP transporter small permease [Rhodobacter sp. NTK016B]MBN8291188.1 TRAP transporter small permease [Rhodobacter sp. NTK016B]